MPSVPPTQAEKLTRIKAAPVRGTRKSHHPQRVAWPAGDPCRTEHPHAPDSKDTLPRCWRAPYCPHSSIRPTGEINANECHYCLDCQVTYWDAYKCPPLVEQRKRCERRGQQFKHKL